MAKERSKKSRWVKRTIWLTLLAVVIGGSVWFIDYLDLETWESLSPDKITNVMQTILIYDQNGEQVTSLYALENRIMISIDQIPKHVKDSFIAAEDLRFYSHNGLDLRRIAGAILQDIKSGGYTQGASTITQQLVKLSHLSSQKTIARKLQEAYLALQLESQYSKDEILEMYLNFIYFGNGCYGIEAAAQGYFGIPASALSVSQSALLAGVIKSPSKYAPHLHPDNAVSRRNLILSIMKDNQLISEEQAAEAMDEKLALVEKPDGGYPYGYYVDAVISQAEELLGLSGEDLLSGGYRIFTTLNAPLQQECERLFANEDAFPANSADGTPVEAALSVVDPQTGAVLALMGGREHTSRRGFNRATDSRRQPGSAIKPVLVYAPAVEYADMMPSSFILDEPLDINGYAPQNFDHKFRGWVTMRQAAISSLNIPAVKLLQQVGLEDAIAFARSVGIEFNESDNHLSLALGGFTTGVSPLQLSAAYSIFANGGQYREPYMIDRILDAQGVEVYQHKDEARQVLSSSSAYIVADMLTSVVESGTARNLALDHVTLAAKTGTVGQPNTSGNKDIWVSAFSPEYSATLWMGYDKPGDGHMLPEDITGGTVPVDLMKEIFSFLYNGQSSGNFDMPSNLVSVNVDKKELYTNREIYLASEYTPKDQQLRELFYAQDVPMDENPYWRKPQTPVDLMAQEGVDGRAKLTFTCLENHVEYRVYRKIPFADAEWITTLKGESGTLLSFPDDTALTYQSYQYYVIAIHMGSLQQGVLLESDPSRTVEYTPPHAPDVTFPIDIPMPSETVPEGPASTASPLIPSPDQSPQNSGDPPSPSITPTDNPPLPSDPIDLPDPADPLDDDPALWD